jgi:hypothetical protein
MHLASKGLGLEVAYVTGRPSETEFTASQRPLPDKQIAEKPLHHLISGRNRVISPRKPEAINLTMLLSTRMRARVYDTIASAAD